MEEQMQQLQGLDVTVTTTMQVLGVVVALALQFVKAFTARWDFLSDEMRKPLWPLLSIVLTAFCFYAAKVEGWFVSGVLVGLAAGGGYSLFSGITKAGVKPPPIMPVILLLCGFMFIGGCGNVWMAPDYQSQFNQFGDSAHVWLDRCRADPNTCGQGLTNMVNELDVWMDIVNGTDPNVGGSQL